MKKIGIYSGSFNPIHHGHVMLANYLVEFSDLDELWFVVSPQNPFKRKADLLDDDERLRMVQLAVGDDPRFRVSDVEMHLPTPSYTINTLTALSERYPEGQFVFICGMDSLQNLHQWREYQKILDNYKLLVFPRESYDGGDLAGHPSVTILKTPILEISSTFIRNCVAEGRDVRHFMPAKAFDYMQEMGFYKAL